MSNSTTPKPDPGPQALGMIWLPDTPASPPPISFTHCSGLWPPHWARHAGPHLPLLAPVLVPLPGTVFSNPGKTGSILLAQLPHPLLHCISQLEAEHCGSHPGECELHTSRTCPQSLLSPERLTQGDRAMYPFPPSVDIP